MQTPGLDYFETFSPMVKASTIRIMFAIIIFFQWLLRQLDVQNVFLNGDLDEQVFMAQPRGFVDPQFPSYVCKLNKALYGLKQAPQAWFHKLSHALLQWGFQASRADSSMFFRHSATDVLILLVYVDDLLVTGSNSSQVFSFISYLNSTFAIHDLGRLNYFLGIKVIHHGNRMHLSQLKYV